MVMQAINWGQFNAKFNGRQQAIFEWLCYLLFCIENNQYLGIARYQNHAGIETNPIKVGEDWIGWQAKFYDTPLSQHKQDFKDSIDTTKKRHPEVTKIVFYTNRDFGQDKKKTDPPYKIEIEAHAKSQGVSIEWKTASFFESVLVTRDNAALIKYFFSPDKSIIDLIEELNQHSDSILKPIRSTISFNGNDLKIDRAGVTQELETALEGSMPIVLSGDGGVGKTAVIKDLYDSLHEGIPIFVLKASEFNNLSNVNALVRPYGDFSAREFLSAYSDVSKKCLVIDSSEKLADIEDKDVFREFIRLALENEWQIVFTTRRNYLEDLKIILTDSYGLGFQTMDIRNLTETELDDLAQAHKFDLPSNSRMADLIRNPFYLNEYLQNYGSFSKDVTYSDFKKLLWGKQIANNAVKKDGINIKREDSFLELARRRSNQGSFSVDATGIDQGALQKLLSDEIIGYDDKSRRYFIAHDIYEEWALDRIVEVAFERHRDGEVKEFFAELGDSLPVRRAFRHWLSDKLLASRDDVKSLIENSVNNQGIPSYWRDEVLVSILLSDHAQSFFEMFEKELLADKAKLLVRVTFLLRIACKSIDEDMLRRFGLKRFKQEYALQTLFTAPRGSGWDCAIRFINAHKETLGLDNMGAIIALLTDWNNKNLKGVTTKNASEIALFYYNELAEKGLLGYSSRDFGKKMIKVILSGSSEIKEELSEIVDDIIKDQNFNHRSKYYDLAEAMLSSLLDSSEVARAIPSKVIELAGHIWMKPKNQESSMYRGALDMEDYFGITSGHRDHYPPSALQTPVSVLLGSSQQETIDFILRFTNKAVEAYRQSELSQGETEEIELRIGNKAVSQLASHRLWNLYRGSQAASSTLQSVLIALEKWLLQYVQNASKEEAEKLCIYLLEHSNSVAVTAVVTSVVMSQPYKLFNVAAILFRTKELFSYDKARHLQDLTRKSELVMFKENFPQNFMTKIHEDERIAAADDKHRQNELENIAVYYQFFKPEDVPEGEVDAMQKEVWQILDEHYGALPSASNETESDKVWRLGLARMDRRKMHPTTEHKDGQTLISFNPELDPDLKKFSEKALQENNEAQRHIPLKLWSSYRWKKEPEKYKTYTQYEEDYKKVIAEAKEIIVKLQAGNKDAQTFDSATPVYACAVLVRDFADKLTPEEKSWCKDIVISYASRLVNGGSTNIFFDGTDAAIGVLPFLFGISDEDDKTIKSLLLLTLFNRSSVGGGQTVSDLSLVTILHNLWKINKKAAQSVFLGYLLLSPKYDELREEIRKQNITKQIYELTEEQILKELDAKYDAEIESVLSDTIVYDDIVGLLQTVDIDTLETAFELIPYETQDKTHKDFLAVALTRLAERIFDDNYRYEQDSYKLLEKIAHFILTSDVKEIPGYLQPFIDHFNASGEVSELLEAFISAADKIGHYEEFWTVWNLLYDSVVKISRTLGNRSDVKQIVRNYLLAWRYWKETAREWYLLKDRERLFYKKASIELNKPVTVLYSLAKVLYDIGSHFVDDGIVWISDLLENHPELDAEDLEVNTVYHLEHVMRRYISTNRQKIKSSPALKKRVIKILDFLIEKASVAAYIMREDIL